ncbi:hypothetical protein [Neobacillus mesonae]|uniref:hypothetical protein n=1 Tax=Neobacillus mesonae TaxID=1193713 RepID=UPI00203FF739|nr:hypothetical protein [Neobacillus mesonae]MCM3571098.1 hypothetical protein [Neobacillus mesonae]
MSIELAIIILACFLLLVMGYVFVTIPKHDDEKGLIITPKGFNIRFPFSLFSILFVIAFVKLPHIPTDYQTISYLLLASKFISILTLAGNIVILR